MVDRTTGGLLMKDHQPQWIAGGLTCRDVTTRTSDYLDERLPVLANIRIGLHLACCSECRSYATQIALIRDTLAQLPAQRPSPEHHVLLQQTFSATHSRSPLVQR